MTQFSEHYEYADAVIAPAVPYVKPIVRYHAFPGENITVGESATVLPVDHPATYLNGRVAHTSGVVSVGPDGSFETRNTRYVRATA